MSLLVALLASTLFISNAMKDEYNSILDTYPDIIITNQKAMRDCTIDENLVNSVLNVKGVSSVVARVWGEYTFTQGEKKFMLIGRDEFESYANPMLNAITKIAPNSMLISVGVSKALQKAYYSEYFNFIKADGSLKKIFIQKGYIGSTIQEKESLIVMSKENLREIFNYKNDEATDLGVSVANENEVAFIAGKIKTLLPNMRVVVKDDLRVQYENIYNLQSGFFLTIFIITFFTFFIIIYDKVSGLNSEQKYEIGILKAIGWRVGDVLNAKLYEGLIISLFSYIMGISMAFIYVYVLDAPLLKKIFLNNYDLMSDFSINFSVDYETLALLFLLSVPIYIAATIIPSWRVATLEADEVMR
jgi:ABC-type lipoprotein release transport system permease subunit